MRNGSGMACGWPRKNDPVAANMAKHIRHRCLARRLVPAGGPDRSMRTSPAAHSRRTKA